jgi:hypothetical protein
MAQLPTAAFNQVSLATPAPVWIKSDGAGVLAEH